MRRGAAATAVVAMLLLLVPIAPGALADEGGEVGGDDLADCTGAFHLDDVEQHPGPEMRFGINLGGAAGVPDADSPQPEGDRVDAALAELGAAAETFTVLLDGFAWADGEEAFARYLARADHYTSLGYAVTLQVRYRPTEELEGDITAWTEHVREVIRRFGPNPLVTDYQITHEATVGFSEGASDGAFDGAYDALVQGVIAAKDEATRLGHDHAQIGFSWFYRLDPEVEEEFWRYLRDEGGEELADALDWIGLDAYPGTYFPPSPPADVPAGIYDAMVDALSTLRCFADHAGIPFAVPIRVVGNGWPTGIGRPPEVQALALETLVRAVHDHCGTYNVDRYHWSDLRDDRSDSLNLHSQHGIVTDDYSPKPAFERYAELIGELSQSELCAGAAAVYEADSDEAPGGEPVEAAAPPPSEADAPRRGLPATGGGLTALALALAAAGLALAPRRRTGG